MTWPVGYGVLTFEEIDSTNEEARRRAAAGEAGPLWIHARHQTAGRGRRGRTWTSPTGNLMATLLLRPEGQVGVAAQLSFVAALAVADLLAAHAQGISVKWPNDVLIGGRKAAGILLESAADGQGGVAWLAVGVGVNLAAHPEGTEFPATSLAAEGVRPPEPGPALTMLAHAFDDWFTRWRAYGFAPIREAWLNRAAGLGGPIVARLSDRTLEGRFEGLDETGALELLDNDGHLHRIAAGDVFFPQRHQGRE
jgi:BirA family biotin operon repressor/biotin-[acetyl-CoA-carboxylase] ligase